LLEELISLKLSDIGWNNDLDNNYEKLKMENIILGRVSFHSGKQYKIITTDGELSANLSNSFIKSINAKSDLPSVGDWICLKKIDDFRPYQIVILISRKNKLSRKVSGKKSEEQIIASNIDIVFIVTSVDNDFNIRRLERYVSMVNEIKAKPIVIINKIDKCKEINKYIEEIERNIPEISVLFISAKTGENIDQVGNYLKSGLTAVLVGSSGVGKSSIINKLLGYSRQNVGEIRKSDGKGRHITSSRELIMLPNGGLIIDNPGIRELQLWSSGGGISQTFQDIEELSKLCKFRQCLHETEPDCAVKKAVDDGNLDLDRLNSYKKLMKEREYLENRRNIYEKRKKDKKLGKIYRQGKSIRKYKGND
jgi:ribosome biogenesis GTPase